MLTRLRQFGIAKEGTEGSEETLSATHFRGNFKDVSAPEYEAPAYERNLMRGSLSKDEVLKSARYLMAKVTMEAAGGSASVEMPWHDALEACGFSKTNLKSINVGTVSGGTFTPGDLIGNHATQGSATKTGIFVRYTAGTPNKVLYIPTLGTLADTDTIYNYESPQVSVAVDTGASPVNAGWAFRLMSENGTQIPASATFQIRDGEQVHTGIGARGKVNFRARHNEPLLMEFEFQGPCKTASDLIPAGAFVTGVTPTGVTPTMGKGFPVLLDAFSPVLTELSVNIDNTLAKRPNLNTNAISESGYMPCRITDRRVAVTIDPEHPVLATKKLLDDSLVGATYRMYLQIGQFTPGSAAGTIVFMGPKAQLSGDMRQGDRDGIVIDNAEMMLAFNGVEDDEFVMVHAFV
jgi:hypothetical protein